MSTHHSQPDTEQESETTTTPYRQFMFPAGHPRIDELKGLDPYEYREFAKKEGTFTGGLVAGWQPLYLNDFTGVTSDGDIIDGLYPLEPAEPGEEAPVEEMIAAVKELFGSADPEELERLRYAVDAVEWQTWANPEFMQFDTGVRLEFASQEFRDAALDVVKASLSPEGYELTRAMMRINGFLGEVVGLPNILNDFSYNFAVYGEPDLVAPWGWQLFGHHCAVNCLVVEGRMTLSLRSSMAQSPMRSMPVPMPDCGRSTTVWMLVPTSWRCSPMRSVRRLSSSTRWSIRRCLRAVSTRVTNGIWLVLSRTIG